MIPYSPANRWRPFCSERCKMIDLGAWASDGYVLPGEALEAEDDFVDLESGRPRDVVGPTSGN